MNAISDEVREWYLAYSLSRTSLDHERYCRTMTRILDCAMAEVYGRWGHASRAMEPEKKRKTIYQRFSDDITNNFSGDDRPENFPAVRSLATRSLRSVGRRIQATKPYTALLLGRL